MNAHASLTFLTSSSPLTNEAFLARQSARESNARSYPRRFPIAIARAAGIRVTDVEGKTYLDCLSGAGALALGHNHPAVHTALRQVLDSGLPLHTLDLTTPIKDAFVSTLFEMLPPAFAAGAKIQFCSPSGSDAVEAALKLAKTATGRAGVIAFSGAYHGMTAGALSLMGNLGPKERIGAGLPDVHIQPYPYAYRCPFGQGGEQTARVAAHYLESLLEDPESGILRPAAVILEAVQGEGGVIPAPVEWLRAVRRITQKLGIALILDEVQSGCGRTGHFLAFEAAGITPDIVVMSKAIGGGQPLAVVVYDSALDTWSPGAHAGTFRGNQLAMAAGMATLRVIREEGLLAQAAQKGARLMEALQGLSRCHAVIGDIRGAGLMIGMEMVDPSGQSDRLGHPPASRDTARNLQAACFRRGLILEAGGRHGAVLRFLPPLTLSDTDIDQILEILEAAFGDLEQAGQ